MYIRWKEKPRDPKWGYDENQRWRSGVRYGSMLHVAYLVESKRLNGKPRQTSKYLASIQENRIQSPYDRARFWQAVQKKLQPLNLSLEQQQAMKTALLKRVPDVTREQIEQANEEIAEVTTQLKNL